MGYNPCMRMRPNPSRAFTLIELLVVISIIALLASIVLASLAAMRDKARVAAGKQFAGSVERAAGDYLAGSWNFDECSGSTTVDLSGNGYNGTLNNAPTWSADSPYSPGCSLLFNGTNQTISLGNVQGGVAEFTWVAWIKTTQIATHASNWGHPAIMGTIQASGNTDDVTFMVDNGYLSWFDELGFQAALTTNAFVSDGAWHQVAAVKSGGRIALYLDGKLAGSRTSGANGMTSAGMVIGRAPWSTSMYFAGNIDQVRVFSKGLTASEMGRLYAADSQAFRALAKTE